MIKLDITAIRPDRYLHQLAIMGQSVLCYGLQYIAANEEEDTRRALHPWLQRMRQKPEGLFQQNFFMRYMPEKVVVLHYRMFFSYSYVGGLLGWLPGRDGRLPEGDWIGFLRGWLVEQTSGAPKGRTRQFEHHLHCSFAGAGNGNQEPVPVHRKVAWLVFLSLLSLTLSTCLGIVAIAWGGRLGNRPIVISTAKRKRMLRL